MTTTGKRHTSRRRVPRGLYVSRNFFSPFHDYYATCADDPTTPLGEVWGVRRGSATTVRRPAVTTTAIIEVAVLGTLHSDYFDVFDPTREVE